MRNFGETDGRSVRAALLLDRIAMALDRSVESFSESASDNVAQTVELMRLWLTLEHQQDRAKVLSFIRNVTPAAAIKQGRRQ